MTNGVRFLEETEGLKQHQEYKSRGTCLKKSYSEQQGGKNNCIDINRGSFTHTLYFLRELGGKTISLNCGGVGV